MTHILFFNSESNTCFCAGMVSTPGSVQDLRKLVEDYLKQEQQRSAVPLSVSVGKHPGRPSRPVVIVKIDSDSEFSGRFKIGDTFDSTHSASIALGYHPTRLRTEFSVQAKQGNQQASLKGVWFNYADQLQSESVSNTHID